MDYNSKLKHHYKPKKGWINDPNGLVWFKGYYHVFYQHSPNYETPGNEPMHWGHSITEDFVSWEELPLALSPSEDYDKDGCWSGTAIVKDGILYLFYASIKYPNCRQSVSVAYSEDGINFKKYEGNPVISIYPADGSPDFRDPAVAFINGKYYMVMASGYRETKKGRLLLYKSDNLFDWEYSGIMSEWDSCKYTECPSFLKFGNKYLLSASVCHLDESHYFSVMLGSFENDKFKIELSDNVDKGPDQYAGQIFHSPDGRALMITWIPGWDYKGFAENDIGCMSLPREITVKDNKILAYPPVEVRHLLKDSDPAVKITEDGFVISGCGREKVVHKGKINDLKILRDEYVLEVFVNKGEAIYSVIL